MGAIFSFKRPSPFRAAEAFQGRAQGGRMLQAGLIPWRASREATPVPALAFRIPDFSCPGLLIPSRRENNGPRREIDAPDASRTNPNGSIAFPAAKKASRTHGLSWIPARERIQGVGERICAAGFPEWPSGSQIGNSGSLNGVWERKMAVRERSNPIGELKNGAGSSQIGSGRRQAPSAAETQASFPLPSQEGVVLLCQIPSAGPARA